LHYGGGSTLYTGPHYWRIYPSRIVSYSSITDSTEVIAGLGNAEFEHDRTQLLTEIEANITRYVAEDARWAVFLLHRVGHHEWEPEGIQSVTGTLSPVWEGTWALEKEAPDWTSPMKSAHGHALIERSGSDFQITIAADQQEDPFLNVEKCNLRYSGGSTYPPKVGPNGQDPMSTVFGYMAYAERVAGGFTEPGANREAVAPLDPATRYNQVLMLCAGGEGLDSARVRFLLLASDTLVEVGRARSISRATIGEALPPDKPLMRGLQSLLALTRTERPGEENRQTSSAQSDSAWLARPNAGALRTG
jgi:hypothetical protein